MLCSALQCLREREWWSREGIGEEQNWPRLSPLTCRERIKPLPNITRSRLIPPARQGISRLVMELIKENKKGWMSASLLRRRSACYEPTVFLVLSSLVAPMCMANTSKTGQVTCFPHIMHQSIPAGPIPLPWATAGHLPTLSVPGVGHSQFYRGPGTGR